MAHELPFGEWHLVPGPRAPVRTLAPVGACIYCRRTEGDGVSLTDEHIIPDGIGGDLLLPRASCDECAEKINAWEQRVQRRHLGPTRDREGIKSRKRRGRKSQSGPLYEARADPIHEDEDGFIEAVLRNAHDGNPSDAIPRGPLITDPAEIPPAVFAEITKGRPEILGGTIPGNGAFPAMSSLEEDLPRPVTVGIKIRGGDFLRLVAKIAHGFAVATVGLDKFSPFLTDIILGQERSFDELWKYVGGIGDNKRIAELHRVQLAKHAAPIRSATGLGTTLIPVFTANIQLFGNYAAPRYEVAVGKELLP